MTKKTLTLAIGAALFIPTIAFAADVQVVNGEAGMIFRDAPSTVGRDAVRAEMKSEKAVQGAWRAVGGEAGWVLEGATYEFDGGRLVHASDCPWLATLTTPAPKVRTPVIYNTGA